MGFVKRFTLRKGLQLPISGAPEQRITEGRSSKTVALLGRDYVGMRPTMLVRPGDTVKLGQPLFEDKKSPGVIYTSPAAGRVASVNRGDKRAFLSVIISREGHAATERVVSLAGPMVRNPRLIRAQLGGCVRDLAEDELKQGESRLISGSVFAGDVAGEPPQDHLGRYHNQISVIREDRDRVLLGWQGPGLDTFSTKNVFMSKLRFGRKFDFSTNTYGSKRAMIPIGMYENVMPLDIVPTYLLRALASNDLEGAISLGALELDEEDLGLCSFVCPGKTEYGPLLRQMLTRISKEG